MGSFIEYDRYDGLGLAELIRNREISPSEVCEEAINRIEKINPKLNAVITPMYDLARRALQGPLPDGPFTGVPFLLKDLLAAYAGIPLTNGCKACKNYIPEQDSELVKRFKKSGVVILGKTNTPEFGLMNFTEPDLHGPTRNPWNREHTPGGSSGGSAAAVAAGMVPLASGGDGGGSIRIPASCCGLFGLKPTRGRVPTGPNYGEIWQGAVTEHVVSRSVRDSAAMLDVTRGPDIGAPFIIQPPRRSFREEITHSPGSLIIAFNTQSPIDTPVHQEYVKATEETAVFLEKLGHRVEEAQPDIDGLTLARSYLAMYFGEVAADIDELKLVLGRKATKKDVETTTWTLGLLGRTLSSASFVKAMREWGKASRAMGRFHQKYDLYLTPTVAQPPAKIGALKPKPVEYAAMKVINTLGLGKFLELIGITDKMATESLSRTPFTQLANFTGQPAMSVPLHWTSDGLPCGMHFMARSGEEAVLLRLAKQLEDEKPWFNQRASVKATSF